MDSEDSEEKRWTLIDSGGLRRLRWTQKTKVTQMDLGDLNGFR